MYSIASSDSGHKAKDNLKYATNRVLTGFASCILKRRRIFLIYHC
uniref:Uncharacterized protein n=1 Tax=Arundo donax TaxID=35708 RepID=A0A0A8ZMP3_ARUDO